MKPLNEQSSDVITRHSTSAESSQSLVAIISELCAVDPGQIGPDFVLASGRLRGSLGRATLDAKIRRRLGVKVENLHALRTMGELQAALMGNQSGKPMPVVTVSKADSIPKSPSNLLASASTPPSDSGMLCGIDVESISALPETNDYWEDPFYQTHFTGREIAYCISQPQPRTHFAARWCAKEALKKCLPECLAWEMNRIEVVRRETGSPYFRLWTNANSRIPRVALSLTHNTEWAFALVITKMEPPDERHSAPTGATRADYFAFAFSIAAFIFALFDLFLKLYKP